MQKIILAALIFTLCFGVTVQAQETETPKTVVNSTAAKSKLLGKHLFSLQWISWDYFGNATVVERRGVLHLTGKQKSRQDSDFVTIDGAITKIEKDQFTFNGKIVTQVSSINDGKECVRDGEMTFKITGNRKYWRLQEMLNPCTNIETDYVDIYFR